MNLTSHNSKTILFTSHNWIEMVESFNINYCLSDCPNWGERNGYQIIISVCSWCPITFRLAINVRFLIKYSVPFCRLRLKRWIFCRWKLQCRLFRSMNVKESEAWTLFREMDKMLRLSGTNYNESMSSTTSEKSKRNDWTKMIACLTNNVSEIRQLFSVDHRESIAWMTASITHSLKFCQISVQWKNESSPLHFTYFHIHVYLRPSNIKTLLQTEEICWWTFDVLERRSVFMWTIHGLTS